MGTKWKSDPWSEVEDLDKPSRWDRPILVVIPESLGANGGNQLKYLGEWLEQQVQTKRNILRYLLPASGTQSIYSDPDILYLARCSYLTSIAWKDDPKYRAIKEDFDRPLRDNLRRRFDQFAVLRTWDYRNPDQCTFEVES